MADLHSGPIKATANDGTLNGYQDAAASTAIYPGRGMPFVGVSYCALKLAGEAGEVADKVGKAWHDDEGTITNERRYALALELGDVMWYVANAAKELGYTLDEIAEFNIAKLVSRQKRGTMSGSGDDR